MNRTTQKQNKSPLLTGHGLPEFKEITPSQINRDIPALLEELTEQFSEIETNLKKKLNEKRLLSWDEVMLPVHLQI